MSKKTRTPFPVHDDVDRALLQVHKAACKLVMIAATNRYTPYAIKAAEALADLGSMAAVPAASVIEQIPWDSRRRLLATVLRDIPPPLFCLDPFLILRESRRLILPRRSGPLPRRRPGSCDCARTRGANGWGRWWSSSTGSRPRRARRPPGDRDRRRGAPAHTPCCFVVGPPASDDHAHQQPRLDAYTPRRRPDGPVDGQGVRSNDRPTGADRGHG